jgi:hypothetical protein
MAPTANTTRSDDDVAATGFGFDEDVAEERRQEWERLREERSDQGAVAADTGDADIGWTAQMGGLPVSDHDDSRQLYSLDQLPDPRLADHAGHPRLLRDEGALMEGDEIDAMFGTSIEPLGGETLRENTPEYEAGVGFRGVTMDWAEPNIGWSAQKIVTAGGETAEDPLLDPQTRGQFPRLIFRDDELPDEAVLDQYGFRRLPGRNLAEERSPVMMLVGVAADWNPENATDPMNVIPAGQYYGHPRGPEPLGPVERVSTRAAVRSVLTTELGAGQQWQLPFPLGEERPEGTQSDSDSDPGSVDSDPGSVDSDPTDSDPTDSDPAGDAYDDMDYRDLQAEAKERDIAANQSADELRDELRADDESSTDEFAKQSE